MNEAKTGETKSQPLEVLEEVHQKALSTLPQTEDACVAKRQRDTGPSVAIIDELDDERLEDMVHSAVHEATMLSNVGSEMSFQLPMGSSARFPPMFANLDALTESGKISSYGVSITTLEEVFLVS